MAVLEARRVGKKRSKTKEDGKRPGTMIRVSDEFAEAFRKACALEDVSSAEFADAHFLPVVRKVYRELLAKEAKQMGDCK